VLKNITQIVFDKQLKKLIFLFSYFFNQKKTKANMTTPELNFNVTSMEDFVERTKQEPIVSDEKIERAVNASQAKQIRCCDSCSDCAYSLSRMIYLIIMCPCNTRKNCDCDCGDADCC
jgi:hypothetical protein